MSHDYYRMETCESGKSGDRGSVVRLADSEGVRSQPARNCGAQGQGIIDLTRRDFGKIAVAAIPGIGGAQTATTPNRSYIRGVQFGLQPFCYHDLPMSIENRPTLIQRA